MAIAVSVAVPVTTWSGMSNRVQSKCQGQNQRIVEESLHCVFHPHSDNCRYGAACVKPGDSPTFRLHAPSLSRIEDCSDGCFRGEVTSSLKGGQSWLVPLQPQSDYVLD